MKGGGKGESILMVVRIASNDEWLIIFSFHDNSRINSIFLSLSSLLSLSSGKVEKSQSGSPLIIIIGNCVLFQVRDIKISLRLYLLDVKKK